MCKERAVFMVAGSLVLLGLAFGRLLSPGWYWLSAFVGLNMLQASVTGFCPLTKILNSIGIPHCSARSPLE